MQEIYITAMEAWSYILKATLTYSILECGAVHAAKNALSRVVSLEMRSRRYSSPPFGSAAPQRS